MGRLIAYLSQRHQKGALLSSRVPQTGQRGLGLGQPLREACALLVYRLQGL